MKKLLSFLIITILFNGISISAQGYRQDPCDAWYSYQTDNISDILINAFDEIGTDKIRQITIDEINGFIELSDDVKKNYNEMRKGKKINDTKIVEWKDYVERINKAIKNGDWPSYDKITKETAKEWKHLCDNFAKEYNRIKSNRNQRLASAPSSVSNRGRGASEENYEKLYNQDLRDENKDLKEGATKAFEVCLFYPLAVKYNKEYVDYAYEAAEQLINSNISTEAPAMKSDWNTYSPLLKNYGKYNDDVIKFIEFCERYIQKSNGIVLKKNIEYIKRNLGTKLGDYYDYYNKEVSIKYLDDVIDEFFDMLNKSAASKRELSDNAFNNFIRIYLK